MKPLGRWMNGHRRTHDGVFTARNLRCVYRARLRVLHLHARVGRPAVAVMTDDALERLIAREWMSYASEQGLAPLGEFGFTDFAAGIRRCYQQAEEQGAAAVAAAR